MKKIFSMMLFVVYAFCAINMNSKVYAEEKQSNIVSLGSAIGNINETVSVPISIQNNQGIISLVTEISYDNTALKFVGVKKDTDFWKSANMTPGGDLSAQPYRIIWYDGLAINDFTEDGTLAELSFEILKEGSHEIKLSVSDDDTFNSNFVNVPIETCNGIIDVESESVTTESTSTTTTTATTISTTETTTTSTTETTTTTTEETTITTEITTSTTETTTTTEGTTTATITTIATETTSTVTTDKYFTSEDELCNMASEDYKQKTGTTPAKAEATTNADGMLSIVLTDENGKVLDTCVIDPVTGIGTSSDGSEVNLPQTGNNSPKTITATSSALVLALFGSYAVVKSGVLRKKEDEQ